MDSDRINTIKEKLKKINENNKDKNNNPQYYNKIKEVINQIISSGYKPLKIDDWVIYACGNQTIFDNGIVEEETRRSWSFVLKVDGSIEVNEISWVGFLQYKVGKYEKGPEERKIYKCSIDSLIDETDYDYSQTIKDGDKTIYINHSTEWKQYNKQSDLIPWHTDINVSSGRRLYELLEDLYKKVLDTPKRRNELIAKQKAEIEEQHKRLEEKRQKQQQQRQLEELNRQKEEKKRQEAEVKARKEAEQRQKEREIALNKMKKEKIEANFFKFVIIVPCCLYVIFLLFPDLFLNLVQINKKLEISLYVIPLIIALLCRVRYICDECVIQWYQTLLVICVSLILFLILNKKDVMGSSIFRWFASCFYSLFVLIIIGYHETKSYLFGFGMLFILHIAIVILAMTKYYIKFEYGWWIGIPAYIMIAISLFSKYNDNVKID